MNVSATAQMRLQDPTPIQRTTPLRIDVPGSDTQIVDPVTGEVTNHQTYERWAPMCGSDTSAMSLDDLRRAIEIHKELSAPGQPVIVVDTPRQGASTRAAGLNIVFNITGTPPTGATGAFQIAETYMESKWADPITITISVSFQALGGGVIGATGPTVVPGISYTSSRNALINGQDSTDTIEDFLPTGSTVPVRFNGATTTITNVSSVDWALANAKAAGLSTSAQVVANMTYNSNFAFDYNPADGVPGNLLSLVDTVIHETGHAMGFISGNDQSSSGRIEALDLYRFQRTNTGGTWNPTNTTQFQTLPRLVSFDSPNDDHIVDFVTAEYRMSDGNPWQGSHFREQSPTIGIMDPAESSGVTLYPNYYKASDLAAFDAIGWNDPPTCMPTVTTQPQPQNAIAGQVIQLSVVVNSPGTGGTPTYQWKRGVNNVNAANTRYSGTTSSTFVIDPVTESDVGAYTCLVTNSCGNVTTNSVNIAVAARCPADRDGGPGAGRPDGAVGIGDLLYFLEMFEAGNPQADLDNGLMFGVPDAAVTVDDLLYMLVHFEAGC